ncbi:hypothetical protein [Ferroacidibacillus organovorans]|uniref:Uncharacterized protein n=1 Tax=Ferroacidibacillus organovorans TaxID=1765683 RepID=A0A162U1F5_9BACL|nr:hypothetical protein [Ferroacidibacillus organovorans]KYP81326.1 hypothetical protein AYJ22_00740 [Ferroacidibacillus organovorans]OAG95113.1 hypothetical protein AYW79_01340 [Ferroacidibacillus organovorans]OPG15103.1 hypothetical protein B2M26_13195 [Ferroacidibacillus organovorans]
MAKIDIVNEKTIRISVELVDAVKMVDEAARDILTYSSDIVTIYEKMPAFDYTNFCFYAYDSAKLFEFVLGMDPRNYNSFSLDAPDAFFYTLYGGMAALYNTAKQEAQSKHPA